MINEDSLNFLADFLQQHSESKKLSTDHVLGFMSALLACSEFYGESEIASYIAGADEAVFNTLMNDSKERDALNNVLDSVTEAQVAQKHILKTLYMPAENSQAPTIALQNWCTGYLAAYMLNQEVWQQDFNFLLNVDKQQAKPKEDGQLFIDNFQASLNLLATFAMWEKALAEHADPTTLSGGFTTLFAGLDESLVSIASMALMLEDEKLALLEEEG
ncbi:UPF0149 family protein [Pseudoalteromonas sp. H105]|uniref:UPF0149 family protein n=1 Tax=Pseudoalteromonas sp. H105 TaxID=1348393 RepID=UPI000731FCBA|nr:UPF0149 family protein [Pseudoalteromonas sp. H105]KTF16976.1 hypothetical protein ATS75_05925 [Pseudoalteromonas sp. H105]